MTKKNKITIVPSMSNDTAEGIVKAMEHIKLLEPEVRAILKAHGIRRPLTLDGEADVLIDKLNDKDPQEKYDKDVLDEFLSVHNALHFMEMGPLEKREIRR